MLYTFLITLHVFICLMMIAVVLLQSGKGAEIGAAFGGSSQTVFGSRGPGTFLSKTTVWAASIFMLTSLSLAILSKQAVTSSSVLDNLNEEVTSESIDDDQSTNRQTIDTLPASEGLENSAPVVDDDKFSP